MKNNKNLKHYCIFLGPDGAGKSTIIDELIAQKSFVGK
jgi:putative ribosome biogenesis GTPase RsgA